jgi:DNA-binding NtrC family response regulator
VALRLLASTRKNLGLEVAAGRFRRDLYYRLTIDEYVLPPLRERKEDIHLFASHFSSCHAAGERPVKFSPHALTALQEYHWPGNIREFKDVIRRTLLQRSQSAKVIDEIAWATVDEERGEAAVLEAPLAAGPLNGAARANGALASGIPPATPADYNKTNHPQFVCHS